MTEGPALSKNINMTQKCNITKLRGRKNYKNSKQNRRTVELSSKTKRTLDGDSEQSKGCVRVSMMKKKHRAPCNHTGKWRRPCAESGLPWVEPLPKTAAYVYIYLEFYWKNKIPYRIILLFRIWRCRHRKGSDLLMQLDKLLTA